MRQDSTDPSVKYAQNKKAQLNMLTKAVEQKSNKVAELKERLNQLQIRNTSLKAELSTKESACSDFD